MKKILSTLLVLSLFVSTTALAKAKTAVKKPSRSPASAEPCPMPERPTLTARDRLPSDVRLTLPEIEKYASLLAKWGNHSLYCSASASCEMRDAYRLQHIHWGDLDRKARLFNNYGMVPAQPAMVINGRQIQGEIAAHRDDFDSVSTRAFNVASLAFIQRRDSLGTAAACAAEETDINRYKNKNTAELLDYIRERLAAPPEEIEESAAAEPAAPPAPIRFGPAEGQDDE